MNMAISKFVGAIHASKGYSGLKNTISYILNSDKTEGYIGSLNCTCKNALKEMKETDRMYGKQPKKASDRLGYHLVLAWREGTAITAETALQVCEEFCKEYLQDYEVVFSVHTDQPHIHAHICFHSVSVKNGLKYQYHNGDWDKEICPMVDKICQKYGLPTLNEELSMLQESLTEEEERERKARNQNIRNKKQKEHRGHGKSNVSYYDEKKESYSKQDHLRVDIDAAIMESSSYPEFLSYLLAHGYEIKTGKYLAIRGVGMERFRRTYRLGAEYSEENIQKRIEAKFQIPDIQFSWNDKPTDEKLQRYGKICLTKQSRKHYLMQYREGLLKPGQNRAYYAIRKAIKEKERQEKMKVLLELKGISDMESAKQVLNRYPEQVEEMKKKRSELKQKLFPYQTLFKLYDKCKASREAYACFMESKNSVFLQDYRQYQEFLDVLKHYKMSEEVFLDFYQNAKQEDKVLRRTLWELLKEEKFIRKYYGLESEESQKDRELKVESDSYVRKEREEQNNQEKNDIFGKYFDKNR